LYEGGIIHFVEKLNAMHTTVFPEPLYFHELTENGEIEIAMQYNDTYNEVIYAYAKHNI
jgi:DNA gyrase subunit B